MIRSELVARLQELNPHLYGRECEAVVNTIIGAMAAALAQGNRVELRGFGAFTVKERDARAGRNPRSGAVVAVEAKRFIHFKMSKEMKQHLNPSEAETPDETVTRILERC